MRERLLKPANLLCLAVILTGIAVVCLALVKPLYDNDFYWHLKSGEWIWNQRAIPTVDPFAIEPQPEPTDRSLFLLSSYWLFQLLLHLCHALLGLNGIIVFRGLMMAGMLVLLYRSATRRNLLSVAVVLTGGMQLVITQFPERPQFISFIAVGALLASVFSYLKRDDISATFLTTTLALTMLTWANMHGGFILGQLLLVIILLAETAKLMHPSLAPAHRDKIRALAIAITIALAASLINPNPIRSFRIAFAVAESNSFLYATNLEYSNLLEYFRERHDLYPALVLISFALTILLICSAGRPDLTWIVLLLLFGYMGSSHIRYYPFFAVTATIYALQHLHTIRLRRFTSVACMALLIAICTCSIYMVPREWRQVRKFGWVPIGYFPARVCDTISANGLQGNVFTTMDWGGYVLWRLAPQRRVFCDGRQIFPSRYWEYLETYNLESNGFYWKKLVERYNIGIVILPRYDYDDTPYKLTEFLRRQPEWRELPPKNNAAVFLKNRNL